MSALDLQLIRIGRILVRWRVTLLAAAGGAVWLALLFAAAWADWFLRFGRAGRLATAAALAAAVAALLLAAARAAARRFPPVAVSAALEHVFPQLDNRLINFVQFESRPAKNAFELAYLATPPPALDGLDLRALRNARAHRRAWTALAIAAVLLALPAAWSAPAWSNALLRILNPFSNRPPTLLARILSVAPGSVARLQGAPVTLECLVEGRRDQPVTLELMPAGGRKSLVRLGALDGSTPQTFSFTLDGLTSETRYRFRAGDDSAPLHTLTPRPPLAFQSVELLIEPPAYTGLEPRSADALAGENLVPEGSALRFRAAFNFPIVSCVISNAGARLELQPGADPAVREGVAVFDNPAGLIAEARDGDGFAAAAPLLLAPLADRPPHLQLVAPLAPVILSPGSTPRIQWVASDDYGLSGMRLERIIETRAVTTVVAVANWSPENAREWAGEWTGEPMPTNAGAVLAYRLTATDNKPGQPQSAVSPLIVFQSQAVEAALDENRKTAEASLGTLDLLIRLQQENLDRTESLANSPGDTRPGQWHEAAQVQQVIRQTAGQLAADPRNPLGALKLAVQRLWQNEMVEAIQVLARLPDAREEEKPPLSQRAIALQRRILDTLSRVNAGMARVQQHREITGLLAMLDVIIKNQQHVRDTTQPLPAGSPAPAPLVDRQDALAAQLADFINACEREARTLEKGDARFAALIRAVAAEARERQIAADMIRAAEALETGDQPRALTLQDKVLAALRALEDKLNEWRVGDAEEKAEIILDAVAEAKAKLEKLRELQARIVESMREVDSQPDKSDKMYDELLEEVSAVKSNMAEAILQVANDLHIFPELPVGNDLVEDVFQVYEDMKQVPGSAEAKAGELGLQKEDWILEKLEKAEERLDDMEMWLSSEPDKIARNTENFDQAELPKIPIVPMPTELEDLIGDLLEQAEEEQEKAHDSATNQGHPDLPAGWEVAEGEFVNFSAKGKSGNQPPDHKEQDGRSLVGREGMSDGETTAGSGKINEGDPNIEARRTRDSAQAGQVQEDDHADAKATGGGKLSGYAEEDGMAGAGPRRDAAMEGSDLGLQAQLKRDAEALYAKASLMHVRTGALEEAVEALRRASDALDNNRIQQLREYQRQAVTALKKARAELNAGLAAETLPADFTTRSPADQTAGIADEAPEEFRDLVSQYFKSLNQPP